MFEVFGASNPELFHISPLTPFPLVGHRSDLHFTRHGRWRCRTFPAACWNKNETSDEGHTRRDLGLSPVVNGWQLEYANR